jgi:hypothetical protein
MDQRSYLPACARPIPFASFERCLASFGATIVAPDEFLVLGTNGLFRIWGSSRPFATAIETTRLTLSRLSLKGRLNDGSAPIDVIQAQLVVCRKPTSYR